MKNIKCYRFDCGTWVACPLVEFNLARCIADSCKDYYFRTTRTSVTYLEFCGRNLYYMVDKEL